MEAAAEHGLNPADYNLAYLQARWESAVAGDQAFLDLLLTDAFLQYAGHLVSGRYDPGLLDPKWHIERPRVRGRILLHNVVDGADVENVFASLAPTHPGYPLCSSSVAGSGLGHAAAPRGDRESRCCASA